MASGGDVLQMLIPSGGWIITGNDFSGIQFIDATPITQAEFEAGFTQYDAWKSEQDAQAAADKASATAKLEALGLTANDLKAIGL
jgi:hypothetical protein